MIKLLPDMPANVVAFTASGQVTGEDYEKVLVPAVEEKFREHAKIRLLYHLGPDFKKFTSTAFWDDARVGLHHLNDFERIAVVTDIPWIQTMVKGIGPAVAGRVRIFTNRKLDEAGIWIRE